MVCSMYIHVHDLIFSSLYVHSTIRSEVSFQNDMHLGLKTDISSLQTKIRSNNRYAKRIQLLGGSRWWRWDRDVFKLGSEDLKSIGAPLPLEQKHTVWIRTGNFSLTKRNALTTEPRMQIWHVKMRIIAIIKSYCKKEFTTRKTGWIAVLLLANSGAESHNESGTWQH